MPEGIETTQAAGIVDDDELELLIGARILDGVGLRGGVSVRQGILRSVRGIALV